MGAGRTEGAFEASADGTNVHVDAPDAGGTCTCGGEPCEAVEDGTCPGAPSAD